MIEHNVKKLFPFSLLVLFCFFGIGSRAAEVSVDLGPENIARRLFSYPNAKHETDSLEKTIKHYMDDAITREAISGVSVTVTVSSDKCVVKLSGSDEATLKSLEAAYEDFFKAGETGLEVENSLSKSGKWNPNWKFLLPLGVPVLRSRAIEVMNFPPLSLIEKQDYYDSETTNRWWELLRANGVPESEKYLYSCILDIVPVAAPADEGEYLTKSGIYEGPFDSYDFQMLRLMGGGAAPRPLMALGAPIRKWLFRLTGVNLGVLDVATLTIGGRRYPVIASNHPSFFFYAVKEKPTLEKKYETGLGILRQDIVAAAWHQEMGRDPCLDPKVTLEKCRARWKGRVPYLLKLVQKHAELPEPSPEIVADLIASEPSLKLSELEAAFDKKFQQR